MPEKPSLILVHGMGEHTEKSFRDEVVAALDYALGLYPGWQGKSIETLVDIKPFEYDSVFNTWRAKAAEGLQPLLAALRAADLSPLIEEFTEWHAELEDDDAFKTHWLDVLLYRLTVLSVRVQLKLARYIAENVGIKGGQNVHVLAHSLGTSLAHDTLATLYIPKPDPEKPENLPVDACRLGSLHLFANVSRVLETSPNEVHESIVHPCRGGCTVRYFQYRHALDPITWPRPFRPVHSDVWTDPFPLPADRYGEQRPELVTEINTHAIGHYLRDPECHVWFLNALGILFRPSASDIAQARAVHKQTSLQGAAEELEEKWRALDLETLPDFEAVMRALLALRSLREP
jgi:hypothetical protein